MNTKRKLVLLTGSKSDIPAVRDGINLWRIAKKQELIEWEIVDICSAHRNPRRLREIIREYTGKGVDAIVIVAGKLAAIFGEVDAELRNGVGVRNGQGNSKTRVIAVPLKGKTTQSSLAALYSVLEVPNHKLIFQEEFYQDSTTAFEYALYGGLPRIELEKQKVAERLTPEEVYELSQIKYAGVASYDDLIKTLEAHGFYHLFTGKTRETFMNPYFPDLLYILATDRISIFDIVLNARVEMKGAVLTAMTVHWLKNVFTDVPNHLVVYGRGILDYLPKEVISDAGATVISYLMKHMLVVKKAKVLKVEAIVRGFITGSGWKDYQKDGKVCGIRLPVGLRDGSELPTTIFTPSTKEDYGLHDENIPFRKACKIIGKKNATFVRDISLYLYTTARETARQVGIIIADTKMEFGIDQTGNIILIDELLTPDSSRFWPEEKRLVAMENGHTPPSLDKQPVRDAGEKAGVKENPNWIPPKKLLANTSRNYQKIFQLLSGKPIQQFWSEDMGI